jgi:hypothetical protein
LGFNRNQSTINHPERNIMATANKTPRKTPVTRKTTAKKAVAPEAAQQALPLEEGHPKPSEPAPQTARLDVSSIDILDLRDLSVPARFHALNMLSEAGYLLAGALDRPAIEHFHLVHDEDAFKLQHNNKLIFIKQWCQIKEGEKIGVDVTHRREGIQKGDRIVVANYERLHYFSPADFHGVVCDESSILKNFTGQTKKDITRFMAKIEYRLLGTATAAPNDFVELGTSSEALGNLPYMDVLQRFFVDDKDRCGGNAHGAASYDRERRASRVHGYWRLKGHSERHFWKWVCSWARACRKPSDLGFDDGAFVLPELIEQDYLVEASTNAPGLLFALPAIGLKEQREERRRTIKERCEKVAELVGDPNEATLVWCHLNEEASALVRMIPDAEQVSGADDDDDKDAATGRAKVNSSRRFNTNPRLR